MINSVIRTIVSVIGMDGLDAVNKTAKTLAANPDENYKSIARQSDKAICQFPVISSNAMTYDTAIMVTKACERNFTSFMQVVVGLNSVIDSGTTATQYISRFHTNIDNDGTTGTTAGAVQTLAPKVLESLDAKTRKEIHEMLVESNMDFESQFEMNSINNRFRPVDVKTLVKEEISGSAYVRDEDMDDFIKDKRSDKGQLINDTISNLKKLQAVPNRVGSDKDNVPTLKDTDIKKANELVPSLMQVKLTQRGEGGNIDLNFLIGIKAVLHPVTSAEMINNLAKAVTKNKQGKLFNFLRWTTGEISFLKDLVFSIDEVKRDLSDERDKRTSPWWNLLKNRNSVSRFRKWTRSKPLLPNATIVITQAEVDVMKANLKIDLGDAVVARKCMEELGLIQFVIVDEANDVAQFLIDGQSRYQTYTFGALARDNNDAEKQFKNILKAVNKL